MKNDEIITAILVCAVIVIFITSLQYSFASSRRGKSSMKKPGKGLSFTAKITIDNAMKTIIRFAQNNGYKVDDFNEQQAIIILSDSPSMSGIAFGGQSGYMYPIYLSRQLDSLIYIEVGIKHKGLILTPPPNAPLVL